MYKVYFVLNSEFINFCLIVFISITCVSAAKLGERCRPSKNNVGICSAFNRCHDVIIPQLQPEKVCAWDGSNPIVCCSNPHIDTAKVVEAPNEKLCINHNCGLPYALPKITIVLEDGSEKDIYHLNRTADRLRDEGFTITVEEMFDDAIRSFIYNNGTSAGKREFVQVMGISPVGGRPALEQRMYYMALLGQKKGANVEWFCDGILINEQWVLTAAHCFFSASVDIDVIRLGEYDWKTNPVKLHDNYSWDHYIANIIIHPLYKVNSGYHDVALLKLGNKIGVNHDNIAPICLPWGPETNRKHIGSILTLSGWGSTSFSAAGGSKTNILTEVDLKVFNTTKCDESYSSLLDYSTKWSHGMNENYILCAGSDEGGKDACKGDSGAPLVYQRNDSRMVLAAVVSAGFGCGLKDFPGLYIPINNPFYLQWIKDVAFAECSKTNTDKTIVFPK